MKKGKKYVEAKKLVEKNKLYTKEEAVELVKKTTITKFDSSVEIAMNLNLDTKKAGADYVGDNDYLEKIEKENWFDFDVLIATPDMMPALGKLGKVLGPKGLMPNPKTGTVTIDTKTAVEDVKKGRVEYRTDSYGNLHVIIGKVSFDAEKLLENLNAFVSLIHIWNDNI